MKYIIDKNNIVLREFLRNRLGLSSRLVTKLKKHSDSILVNGIHANVDLILKKNDIVELDFSDKEEDVNEYLEKKYIPIDIIYEDENMTVVNKPFDMPTHQSLLHNDDTLANALAFRYRTRPYVFRAINRLDRDTSGIVLTANNKFYADILSSKLQKGDFHKEYIAIVEGKISENGEINAPIKREKESIIKRVVSTDGDLAITRYEVLLSSENISVLRVIPITGRTHQIRVHMSYIGHPIVGDFLYGTESDIISRQALHAYRLQIEGIGDFKAQLPDDMRKLIRRFFDEGIDEIS